MRLFGDIVVSDCLFLCSYVLTLHFAGKVSAQFKVTCCAASVRKGAVFGACFWYVMYMNVQVCRMRSVDGFVHVLDV